MTRIFLFLMWLAQWLPMSLLALLGKALGRVLYVLVPERRHVTLTNLGLCFPQMSEHEKSTLAIRHLTAFGRSFLERGLCWWASAQRFRRLVRLEGMEHLRACAGQPVILFAPHFVGLDMGWSRLCMEIDMISMYSNQKNAVFNHHLRAGRLRFGRSVLVSRQEGLRPVVKALKAGTPFYYLPDMDYGRDESIFVPFFGVSTATIPGLSRLAAMTGAKVLPVITHMDADGWTVRIAPPWESFPTEDIEADTRRMNAVIEAEIATAPEQYLWMHKRFKTRPPGEKGVY
jgi:KDO2-lipid IV(A) lauroyltransferase